MPPHLNLALLPGPFMVLLPTNFLIYQFVFSYSEPTLELMNLLLLLGLIKREAQTQILPADQILR